MNAKLLLTATALTLFISCSTESGMSSGSKLIGEGAIKMQVIAPNSAGRVSAPAFNQSSAVSESETTVVIKDAAGTDFTLSRVVALVKDIEFDYADEFKCDSVETVDEDDFCSPSSKVALEGPFLADLIRGTFSPDVGLFDIPIGTYKRIDIRIDDAKKEMALIDVDDIMFEHSYLIEGSYDNNGTAQTFALALKFNEDLRIENENGLAITTDATQNILIGLNVAQWMQGVDLTACLNEEKMAFVEGEKKVINDSTAKGSCTEIEGLVKENIKKSFELEKE